MKQTGASLPLNLLALPGADESPGAAADEIVDTLRAQWADSWGPRLDYHLSYLLRTLLAARLAKWPTAAGFHPFTLLDAQELIRDADFRRALLKHVNNSDLLHYWESEFKPLQQESTFFLEVFQPILNKLGAFQRRDLAQRTLGQYSFTPAIQHALEAPGEVLVDLAQGAVGADTARLVASTLLLAVRNLVARRSVTAARAVPLTVVVDELQWLNPGSADRWMAELTKYGAHLIGVTQSVEMLDATAPALRPQVLANISSLFSFALMADDAEAVAPQFDGVVDVNDLLNLTPRQCYAKVFAAGQRQPTFSMLTWPLADGDPALVEQLLGACAQQWGTPADQLEEARQKRAQFLKQTQKTQVRTYYAS